MKVPPFSWVLLVNVVLKHNLLVQYWSTNSMHQCNILNIDHNNSLILVQQILTPLLRCHAILPRTRSSRRPLDFLSPARVSTCPRQCVLPIIWGCSRMIRCCSRFSVASLQSNNSQRLRSRSPHQSLVLQGPSTARYRLYLLRHQQWNSHVQE